MKDTVTLSANDVAPVRSVTGIAISAAAGVAFAGAVFALLDVDLWLGRWMRGFEWKYRPLQWGFTAVFLFLWMWVRQVTTGRGAVRATWTMGIGAGLGYWSGVVAYIALAWSSGASWGGPRVGWHLIIAVVLMMPALSLTWVYGAMAAVVATRVVLWCRWGKP